MLYSSTTLNLPTGVEIVSITFYANAKIPDLGMQYENNANVVDFDCTFTYQYLYDEDDGNPFDASPKA